MDLWKLLVASLIVVSPTVTVISLMLSLEEDNMIVHYYGENSNIQLLAYVWVGRFGKGFAQSLVCDQL